MDRETTRGPISGMDIGKQIIEALGLPAGANLIQIRIGMDGPVEIIARYYPDQAAMSKVGSILRSYYAVLREEAPDATWLGAPVMKPIRHTQEK